MPAHQVDVDLDNRKVVREFVLAHGSENQHERFMAGLLPEGELHALVRNHLFAPFKDFRRWEKLVHGNMRHDKSCSGGATTFSTREPSELDANEWSLYRQICRMADFANNASLRKHGVTAVVSLVEHVGRCSVCPSETYGRAASVRIEWAGRPLSREYSLEGR
jgi:hypothetical protein